MGPMKHMVKTTNKSPDMVNHENFGYYYFTVSMSIVFFMDFSKM